MKRMFLSFLLGVGAGAFGYWYLQQDTGKAQLEQARAQVTSGVTDLTARIGEISETSAEAVKEELARTGTVVREKAKAAGRSIADTAANARTTSAVKARLIAEPGLPAMHINVDTTDGLVTLSGRVDSAEQVSQAVKIALATEGVHKVISTLQVPAK
ncbi:MAG TPA: BON domain-containing protein [Verrucomicrobiae bacterium]|nr:BON domain-containing protein [Verrucomicrobiae bacterium]